jgi:integrase/recombinase XerC
MPALATVATPPAQTLFNIPQRDLLAELLADKRSINTRRAYSRDLRYFFQAIASTDPSPQLVAEFLQLDRPTAIALVLGWKAALIEKGLAEATVNRRLAAVKSLCAYAQKVGKCLWSLEEVTGEKVQSYRDTAGISVEEYRRLLDQPNRQTLKGKRDYAILRLIWDNALRRGEIAAADLADFTPELRTLAILGKGRGTQKEIINLSDRTCEALQEWIDAIPTTQTALFIALDHAYYGHRLTGTAIYNLVRGYAEKAGIKRVFSPHRGRHSSITAALDATGGDVRRVQKLSRHKKLETLTVYDDRRQGVQKEVTSLLSELC